MRYFQSCCRRHRSQFLLQPMPRGKTRRRTKRSTGPTHHAGLTTIPSSFLRVGPALRLSSPCLWDRVQTIGDTTCCFVEATTKDILDPNAQFFCEDETSSFGTYCPLLRNAFDVAASEFQKYSRNRDIHGFEETRQQRPQAVSGRVKPTLSSLALRRYVFPAQSFGAYLNEPKNVFRNKSHAHPAKCKTPMSHEIVLSFTTSAWFHSVPELSSFRFIVRCFQPKPTASTVRRTDFRWIAANTLRKVHGIVNVRDPEMRRMAKHARVFALPCISQLSKTVISSVPDLRLDTAIWIFTPVQHFAHSNDNSNLSFWIVLKSVR